MTLESRERHTAKISASVYRQFRALLSVIPSRWSLNITGSGLIGIYARIPSRRALRRGCMTTVSCLVLNLCSLLIL